MADVDLHLVRSRVEHPDLERGADAAHAGHLGAGHPQHVADVGPVALALADGDLHGQEGVVDERVRVDLAERDA